MGVRPRGLQGGGMLKGAKILLVEDDSDDEALTLRALRRNNLPFDVVVVRDGAEALDFLFSEGRYAGRDPRDIPSLMLLDLKLQKMDGFEVLKRVRADPRTRLLPITVLSTSSEESDIVTSYRLGANSFIRKPVDFTEFMDAVRQLVIYWLTLNAAPPRSGGA